jgi:FAD:protein FMN transferase
MTGYAQPVPVPFLGRPLQWFSAVWFSTVIVRGGSTFRENSVVNKPSPQSRSTRREFLAGRAAARAAESAWDRWQGAAPGSSPGPRPATYLLEVGRRAMACDFAVLLNAGERDEATEVALAALDLVELLEAQLTVYRETSEVSQLNRRASQGPVIVEQRLFQLLRQAHDLFELTEGAFDITTGPLTQVWGFARRQAAVPEPEAIEAAREKVGMRLLEFDESDRSVRFLRDGVELNLGGIGKGYALDRSAHRLARDGIEHFLMHGGRSSMLARGERRGLTGWKIGLRHPLRPDWHLGDILLCDRALGTSGAANQYFHFQGRRLGHVIDPRSGWPAEGLLSATVLAPTAAEADALATACYVMQPEEVERLCQRHPEYSAILVAPADRVGGIEILLVNLHDDQEWSPATPSSDTANYPLQ